MKKGAILILALANALCLGDLHCKAQSIDVFRDEQCTDRAHYSDLGETTTKECASFLPQTANYFFADPYPSSTHNPVLYSPGGDIVQLEDGSIWRIAYEDAPCVCSWLPTDPVQISPNHSWWSAFPFRMQNLETECSVQVGLKMGPFYDSIFTRWVVSINHSTQELWLNDGSHWQVAGLDRSVFQKWLVDDPIIVGTNDDWLSYKMPNILININLYHPDKADLSFVRAVYCY